MTDVRIIYNPQTIEDFERAVAAAADAKIKVEPGLLPLPKRTETVAISDVSHTTTTEIEPTEDDAETVVPPPPATTETATAPPPPPAATEETDKAQSVFSDRVIPIGATCIDLDEDGLPWDVRIHGSGRTKLASGKTKGCWKRKRGVSDELVDQVEAELRAAMAVPGPVAGPDLIEGTSGITTFADLLSVITREGIQTDVVAEAVKAVGLEGLPILATRPDLVPSVAAILFPPVAS